jgi:uncharacterized YigZ family protein
MSAELSTILHPSEAEFEIKKSRFIGVVMPCQSEREAIAQLNQLAGQHATANHLAFAWRIRQQDGFINERCSDGGEPSGTAGRPILAPLEGMSLINVCVGVIRYFGGVKLGTGGLTRAYGQGAKMALDIAKIEPWIEMAAIQFDIDYGQLQSLEYQLKKVNGQIVEQNFTDKVTVIIHLPESAVDGIVKQFVPQY